MSCIQQKLLQCAGQGLWCARLFLFLVCVITPVGAAGSDDGHTIRQVLDVWKARQARVETARFEFEETMVHPKGTLSFGKGIRPVSEPKPAPEHDAVFDRRIRLLLAHGGRIRYEVEGKAWVENLGSFVPQTYISTTNWSTNKSFYGKGRIGEELHPCGFVNNQSKSIDADNYHIFPFLFLARPLDRKAGGCSEEGWTLASAKPIVDGHSCLLLEQETGGLKDEFWVDTERQMTVVRYVRKLDGREFVRCTCSYTEDPKCGWVPTTWEGTMFQMDETIRESARGRMLHYEINSPLKDEDFEFVFPPGTEVADYVAKAMYVPLDGGGVEYLAGRGYIAVLAGPSGLPARRRYWMLCGGSLLSVILIGFYSYRHRMGRKFRNASNSK